MRLSKLEMTPLNEALTALKEAKHHMDSNSDSVDDLLFGQLNVKFEDGGDAASFKLATDALEKQRRACDVALSRLSCLVEHLNEVEK